MTDLRLRRAPVRRGAIRDFATIMAWCAVRRQQREDPDEPRFVEIAIGDDALPATLVTADNCIPKALPTSPMTSPPDPPEECTVIPGTDMPRMREAWSRAAASVFTAGTHGPVSLPLPPGQALPSAAPGHVLLSTNFRPTSSLPLEHQAFIASRTAKEIAMGSVVPVRDWSELAAVMPTFVAVHPTTGKLRIIFDARALNRLLRDPKGVVKYDDVRLALQHAMCATKLDIEGAYRHVRVAAEQQRYLGFEVAGRLYRYTCLPFGVSWSPALFLDMLRPVIDAARRQGVRLVWYMDDLLIVADDVATLDAHGALVLHELMDSGWQPAADKTFPYAFSIIVFLGLLVSYKGPLRKDVPYLSVPLSKSRRIFDEAMGLVEKGVAHVSALQRLCGRLNFSRIVAPQVAFLRRGLDAATAAGLRAFHGIVPVVGRLREDLLAVAHAAQTLHTLTLGLEDETARRQLGRAYSDASAVGWGAVHFTAGAPVIQLPPELAAILDSEVPNGWTVGGRFSDADCALSSGAREVRAVCLGVAALDLRGGHVDWHCDATVAVHCISAWSSRSDHVAQALSDLWDTLQARQLTMAVEHVFRDASFMPVADWLSRQGWREAQAEWATQPADIRRICASLGVRPTADLFASATNHRFERYCSRWLEPGSLGDAFHTSWATGDVWWAFPPTSQLERFATRLVGHLRLAEASRLATSSSSSSVVVTHSSSVVPSPSVVATSFAVVLLYPEVAEAPFSAAISNLVRSHASRDLRVFSDTRVRQLCPRLRLVDNHGEEAPNGPPWPLRAAVFHVG